MADSAQRRPARRRPSGLPSPSRNAIAAANASVGVNAEAATGRARRAPATPSTSADREVLLERAGATLIELLDRQHGVHRRLVEQLEAMREAIRQADVEGVAACATAERTLLAEIERLESRRRDVVVGVTGVLDPGRAEPLPLTDITPHLAPATGQRLLDLRTSLRGTLDEAGRLSAIVTGAAEAVGKHLAGLVQTVGSVIAGPGTYGRRGQVDAKASTPMRLDLTS